jgi:hypothetical protein
MSQNEITLRGSTKIVGEFFWFSINSILYQRGIYETEKFIKVKKYGLPMMVADDPALKQYLNDVLKQFTRMSFPLITRFVAMESRADSLSVCVCVVHLLRCRMAL